MCLKRYSTGCSKFVTYCGLNSQHNWGDLYDQLRKMIFTLIMRNIFICALEITREMVTASTWFHILREVGAELKLSV